MGRQEALEVCNVGHECKERELNALKLTSFQVSYAQGCFAIFAMIDRSLQIIQGSLWRSSSKQPPIPNCSGLYAQIQAPEEVVFTFSNGEHVTDTSAFIESDTLAMPPRGVSCRTCTIM